MPDRYGQRATFVYSERQLGEPLGVAFENIYANGRVGGVVPIVSFDSAFTFRMNLGNLPLRYAAPGPASVRSPVDSAESRI